MLQPAECCLLPPKLSLIAGASEAALKDSAGGSCFISGGWAQQLFSPACFHGRILCLGVRYRSGCSVWACKACARAHDPFPCRWGGAHPTLTQGCFTGVCRRDLHHVRLSSFLQSWRDQFSSKTPLLLWGKGKPGLSWRWMLSLGRRWGVKLGNWGS